MKTRTADRPAARTGRPFQPSVRVLFTGGRVTDGPSVPIGSGSLVCGRLPGARHQLVLDDDPLLSRSHASFHRRDRRLVVADNDSRNGTWLNGQRIDRSSVQDGDIVRVGDTFLLVRTSEAEPAEPAPELLGDAPAMRDLRRTLALVGPSDATVVLIGTSGTGKGQSARALHRLSGRPGPFVAMNCAAIPESLAESTLFGHRMGAFTGARRDEPGFFRAAHTGTLFVDEIGDLPAVLQPKLLHAIEERCVVPVGGTQPVDVDVRIVTATSIDLRRAVRDGRFRGDLFARLAEIVVNIPDLADRPEDVLPLLAGFLGPGHAPLAPELVDRLLRYGWPFNVRELRNIATELRVRGAGQERLEWDLLEGRFDDEADPAPAPEPVAISGAQVADALRQSGGVVSAAARALGLSRRHVYRLLDRHGLDPADYRS